MKFFYDDIVCIIFDILNVLVYVYIYGVIYWDFKLVNIFVNLDGMLVIMDFGLVKWIDFD